MERIPQTLAERLRNGQVVPFVGAGVSMAVQRRSGGRLFPSWRELLLHGADRLDREGKKSSLVRALLEDDPPDYLQAAQKLRERLGAVWAPFLKDELDAQRADADGASLELARAVWRLGSRLVLTTNYDRILSWSAPDDWRDDLDTWDITAPAEQAALLRLGTVARPTVWHLHGRIGNAAELILTPDGYHRLYPEGGEAAATNPSLETLRHVLASRTLLFVGFSLDDEHFGVQLQGVQDLFEGHTGPHYALVHRRDVERLQLLGKPVEPLVFEDFGEPLLALLADLGHCGRPKEKKEIANQTTPPAPEKEPAGEPEYDVYLASVADSLRSLRNKTRDELERQGLKVAPAVPPPFDAASHREAALAGLRRSRVAVHLLDGLSGLEIHDRPGATYPQEQLQLSREQARSQVIWVPRQLEIEAIEEESQRGLLAELEAGARGAASYDFQRGLPSDLAADLRETLQRLRPPAAAGKGLPAVLLDTHVKDQELIFDVSRSLVEQRVIPYVNPLEDDPRQNLELLRDRLRRVGGLIICQGQVNDDWVSARLEEAIKIAMAEPGLLQVFCVYLGPPGNQDVGRYARYRFLNFHLLDNRRGFDPQTLGPLLHQLETA